jgi:hypothetical protein
VIMVGLKEKRGALGRKGRWRSATTFDKEIAHLEIFLRDAADIVG